MKLRDDVNEYGTAITWCLCPYCNKEYYVCPALTDDQLETWADNCLMQECESYDPWRDVELLMFFGIATMERKG